MLWLVHVVAHDFQQFICEFAQNVRNRQVSLITCYTIGMDDLYCDTNESWARGVCNSPLMVITRFHGQHMDGGSGVEMLAKF